MVENADGFRSALDQADLERGIRLQVIKEGSRRFIFLRSGN